MHVSWKIRVTSKRQCLGSGFEWRPSSIVSGGNKGQFHTEALTLDPFLFKVERFNGNET